MSKKDLIITLPNEHLRQKSQRVPVISDEVRKVIAAMKAATLDWEAGRPHEVGVALAAIQIDKAYRIIIVRNNFEDKKEIIRIKTKDGKTEERWTGDYIFENEWQSFRTKKDRNLELTTVFQEVPKGRRKVAVKVVDIFGNDTMKVIEVSI